MKIELIVTQTGYAPANEEAIAARRKYHKPGQTVVANVTVPRNKKFHRKYFALMKMAFDQWEPPSDHTFRGVPIEKEFDHFRHDVTIMAGFYTPVWSIKGEMRIEPQSISFDYMDEEAFDELYSKTIDVLLKMVLGEKGFTKESVDELVGQLLTFDS